MMRKRLFSARLTLVAAAMLASLHASVASACIFAAPPPPPPVQAEGETDDAFASRLAEYENEREMERQVAAARREASRSGFESGLWLASEQIVLATIVGKSETEIELDSRGNTLKSPVAHLEVVFEGRGSGFDEPFTLTYEGLNSCGPYGPVELVRGSIGETFVIMARPGPLGMDTLLRAYPATSIRRGRIERLAESGGN